MCLNNAGVLKRQGLPSIVFNNNKIVAIYKYLVPPSLDYTSDDTTVNETDNVTLFCNATGYPHPRITWTFLRGSESAIVGREEYLPLSNVSRTQAGTYQCTAFNDLTSSEATNVQVTVNCKYRSQC